MNREAYLQELWGRLSNRMPRKELENTMRYYEEYLNEAGPEREAAVMEELGSPEDLVRQIMGDRAMGKGAPVYQKPPRANESSWTGGKVALVICLFPIWLPLLIGGFGVVVGLIAAAFSVVVALVAGGVGCVAVGAFAVWCGFTAIFSGGIPTLVFFGGMGLLSAGLGILMTVGGLALGGLCCKGVAALCRNLFGGKRREVLA